MSKKQIIIQKIKDALSQQRFADWYNSGNFDKWIRGDLPEVTDKTIEQDIARLFRLN